MLKKKFMTLKSIFLYFLHGSNNLFFSIEMINALRQMEDEYVVAENLLGAHYR